MNSTIAAIIFATAILLLYVPIQSCDGYKIQLSTINDTIGDHDWKFPKDRPYHYHKSTKDIPHNFLPVHTSALPEGHGIWVLRYKDFLGLPSTFQVDKSKDTTKSVIKFEMSASFFEGVTIKALAFGDVQFDIVFKRDEIRFEGDKVQTEIITEQLPLFGQNSPENCTLSSSESSSGNGLKWTIFEIENFPNTKMSLEAQIHHSKSFMIVDEIEVKFGDCQDVVASRDGSGACRDKMAERVTKIKSSRVAN